MKHRGRKRGLREVRPGQVLGFLGFLLDGALRIGDKRVVRALAVELVR